MIEAQETLQKNTTGNLKYYVLFLFNDEIQSKNDEQNEKNTVDSGYEKNVLECNKLRSLIKILVGRKITVLSKQNQIMSGSNIMKL